VRRFGRELERVRLDRGQAAGLREIISRGKLRGRMALRRASLSQRKLV